MNVKNSHLGMYIIILALLAACAVTPSPASLPTATMISPTATDTPSPSATPTPSPAMTPTPSSTITPFPTSTATPTPEPNYLSGIACDTEGNLWIGGFGGVVKSNPTTDSIVSYPIHDYAANEQVNTLLITEGQTVWVTMASSELFRLENDVWVKQEDVDVGRYPLYLIAEGEPGTVWVGSVPDFMHYYDSEAWHKYGRGSGVPLMKSFARASDGIWWGVHTCCMITYFYQFDGETWSHNEPEPVLDTFVSEIETASDGSLWFKGSNHLYHYDTNLVWTPYTATMTSDRDWIRTLTVAPNGDVWIGTDEGQIQRFQDEVWYNVGQYPNRSIEALDSAPDGTVWAGTSDDCIIQFDRNGATEKSYRVRQLDVFPDSTCSN